MPTVFSSKHPPKNRVCVEMSPIEMEVLWVEGFIRMDMNQSLVASLEESLPLGTPCTLSDISGEAGYTYRTNEVTVALTREELYRLMRLDLAPTEFFALAEKYGVFYEIHDDFYDEETGISIQPRKKDK